MIMCNIILFSDLAEPEQHEKDSVVDNQTDTDSVKDLGDTTDFLNMVSQGHLRLPINSGSLTGDRVISLKCTLTQQ